MYKFFNYKIRHPPKVLYSFLEHSTFVGAFSQKTVKSFLAHMKDVQNSPERKKPFPAISCDVPETVLRNKFFSHAYQSWVPGVIAPHCLNFKCQQ